MSEFPRYRIGQRVRALAKIVNLADGTKCVRPPIEGDVVYYSTAQGTFTVEWPSSIGVLGAALPVGFQSVHKAEEWGTVVGPVKERKQ